MSLPAVDFQVHNSLFLIAHFHSVIIGGVVFGFFAGFTYWFPKFIGFKLNEKLGQYAFWCWFIGFLAAFMPLYLLGLMGATRRLDRYDPSFGWQPLFVVAAIGVALISCGIGLQILQMIVSIKQRKQNRDTTGDPWNGRTLEWATSSPPPLYNFALLPLVHERDPFWVMKQTKSSEMEKVEYEPIEMPKNTPLGMFIGAFSFTLGFGLIWYMFWLAAASLLGIAVCMIVRLSEKETEYTISAAEVAAIENRISP